MCRNNYLILNFDGRFSCGQGRVSDTQIQRKTPPCPPHSQKMAANPPTSILYRKNYKMSAPIFATILWLRADALAPDKDSELVQKYRQIWKVAPKSDRESKWRALTHNGQFCVIAALPSLENFITFARW